MSDKSILLDNIIFVLQYIGGISNYGYNLLRSSIGNNNIFYFEDKYSNKNYYTS